MPKIIETKIFIEPREAFQLVGKEAYGPNWQAEWIESADSPERKLTLQYLRAALKSGQVAAHWSTMDFRTKGDLTSQEADQEFFHIDLDNDCVFHDGMNVPVYCRIHKEQLRGFMRSQGHRTVPGTQFAIDRCRDWMVDRFRDPNYQPPRVPDHMRQAKELFGNLSDEGYRQARREAIQITERHDLAKAGRRKKSNR